MLILAFDTSTSHGRFALADGSGVLDYRPLNVGGNYADALLPTVRDMLTAGGHGWSDLTTVGVTTGPGSFTGVRIGVATAKALAWCLGCELVAVTTLAAMAADLLTAHPKLQLAVPALDARRGEIFAGAYRRQGVWVEEVLAPAAHRPERWWEKLQPVLPHPEAAACGGDGIPLLLGQGENLRAELRQRGTPALRPWTAGQPATARALAAALAAADDALPRAHPFTLVPTYLRVSDAEVKRRVDLTPLTPSDNTTSHRSSRDS